MNGPIAVRKKPVVVEAWQFVEGSYSENRKRLERENRAYDPTERWPGSNNPFDAVCMTHHEGYGTGPHLHTANGFVTLKDRTWVVRAPDGDVWPVADHIFDLTYERVA